MPKNRIGFSTDFNLTNSKVGIGTTNPRATLDVAGVLKGDFNISGVTTLTSYAGFIPQKQSGDGVTITGEVNTISEDIIVNVGETFTVSSGSTISIGTLESISIGAHLSVPNGGITLRPQDPIEGTVRFNDDLNTLEFYNGVEWRQFTVTGASGRGVFGGGFSPSTRVSTIDYINIQTKGNAVNFGNLTVARNRLNACSSTTRGIYAAGFNLSSLNDNTIDYITIASEGNAIDFGDRTVTIRHPTGLSSSTRGLFGGGYTNTNVIDYITIATIGNALDFGDLTQARHGPGACASATRGVFAGGNAPSITQVMDYVTIASTGNAVDFGDLSEARGYPSGSANSTRGIFSNGFVPGTYSKTIDYITIATLGNATEFGNTSNTSYGGQGCATQTRAIVAVGELQSPSSTKLNVIEYVEINTKSNAFDFGDLTETRNLLGALSDSHGGLGGF